MAPAERTNDDPAGARSNAAMAGGPRRSGSRGTPRSRAAVAAAVVLGTLAAVPVDAGQAERTARLIAVGQRHLEAGRLDEALEAFEKADRSAEGRSLAALDGLGQTLLRFGRFGEVLTVSERMLALGDDPALRRAAHGLAGDAHLAQARWMLWTALQSARSSRSRAGGSQAAVDPDTADPLGAARAHAAPWFEMAETSFLRAMEGNGGASDPYQLRLVEIRVERGMHEQAVGKFELYRAAGGAGERAEVIACWLGLTEEAEHGDGQGDRSDVADVDDARPQVEPPKRVATPRMPQITTAARAAGISGVVAVRALITRDGAVRCPRVLIGLPMGLNDSAVEAVKTWRFEPARRHGQPVAVFYNLIVNFTSDPSLTLIGH